MLNVECLMFNEQSIKMFTSQPFKIHNSKFKILHKRGTRL